MQLTIALVTLLVMFALMMAHITSPLSVSGLASRRSCRIAVSLAGVLVLLLLTGCQTAPAVDRPVVDCEPLPTCDAFIPPDASSTQLEMGLWSCVLEYRALYLSCATRQRSPKVRNTLEVP